MKETVAEVLSIARINFHDRPLFLSINAAHKQGARHVVKELDFWDVEDDSLLRITLDSDACDGTNIRVAEAACQSLEKIDKENKNVKRSTSVADAGSDGMREGLFVELETCKSVEEDGYYHSCGLHALNIVLSNPITKCFCVGGIKNHNSLQLLFVCYVLER